MNIWNVKWNENDFFFVDYDLHFLNIMNDFYIWRESYE
jgi:hypothetical protein